MELFRVLLIILSWTTTSVKCCKKNEKAFRCGSLRLLTEEVCQDVQRASCAEYTIRCKCADGMYRTTRGDCVPRSQCLTAEQVEEEQIRQQNEQNERLFKSAVSVVENHHPIHLLRISMETWINSLCVCMKSTFMASHLNSADRTVECYYHPSDKKLSHITIKTMQVVVFTVVNDNGLVKVTLRPEGGGQLLFDLQTEYQVLGAESTCIVLKTGEGSRGKPYCMLWGVDNDDHKKEDDCFTTLEKVCNSDNFFSWEHNQRCVTHDELAQAALEASNKVVN